MDYDLNEKYTFHLDIFENFFLIFSYSFLKLPGNNLQKIKINFLLWIIKQLKHLKIKIIF